MFHHEKPAHPSVARHRAWHASGDGSSVLLVPGMSRLGPGISYSWPVVKHQGYAGDGGGLGGGGDGGMSGDDGGCPGGVGGGEGGGGEGRGE